MQSILIVGGGFYGMYLASHFARNGMKVTLCEQRTGFMQRASFTNQARVHNGYHYPRSILTALRSRMSYPHFCKEFDDCIDGFFDQYYMIGRLQSNVSSKQFETFCDRIGASYKLDVGAVNRLVDPSMVEAVYQVEEVAFNSVALKDKMAMSLRALGVNCLLETKVVSISETKHGLAAILARSSGEEELEFSQVYNCTYSMLNSLVSNSSLDTIPLTHQITEMCLVEVPEPLQGVGITLMCGPFFSTMPFPSSDLHSFSHVRYTPHCSWKDNDSYESCDEKLKSYTKKTAWKKMQSDAQRFMPILSECVYRRSMWEVKTILPTSHLDDSRPILFLPNYHMKGFHCVLGGKIDNVYDVVSSINSLNLCS